MATFVLVHGGGFDARCWDRLLPHLRHPAVAVDLPGRAGVPPGPREARLADFAAAAVRAIEGRDLTEVVLVGHSMAGVTLPRVMAAVAPRLAHVVFVACTVPPPGRRILDTLDPEVRALAERDAPDAAEPAALDPEVAAAVFCNDMDEDQRAFTLARLVPEAVGVVHEPVDLTGLGAPVPRTWVRLARDLIVPPARQDEFAATVGDCEVVELDAGHMAMVSRPAELASVLDAIAGRSGR